MGSFCSPQGSCVVPNQKKKKKSWAQTFQPKLPPGTSSSKTLHVKLFCFAQTFCPIFFGSKFSPRETVRKEDLRFHAVLPHCILHSRSCDLWQNSTTSMLETGVDWPLIRHQPGGLPTKVDISTNLLWKYCTSSGFKSQIVLMWKSRKLFYFRGTKKCNHIHHIALKLLK